MAKEIKEADVGDNMWKHAPLEDDLSPWPVKSVWRGKNHRNGEELQPTRVQDKNPNKSLIKNESPNF